MPANKRRKYSRIVSYIEDQVGADVNRDLLRMSLVADDLGGLSIALDEISGQAQSAVDVANQIDQIQNTLSSQTITVTDDGNLAIATLPEPIDVSASEVDVDLNSQTIGSLTVTDDGSLAISSLPEPIDASGSEIDVDLNSQTLSPLTITDDGNLSVATWDAGTLPTEQQTPVGVEDSTGAQIDPDPSPQYPETEAQQDLIGTGDLVMGPVNLSKTEALLISANSTDDANWSATVVWQDSSGNVLQTEQPADITLENVQDDYARLIRKGASAEVTFTDTSGGTANNINAYVDAHK